MCVEINFSPEDLKEVQRVANIRNNPKVKAGIKSNLFGRHKFNEAQSHFNGVMAEMAVAFYIGTEMDKTSKLGGDGGAPDLWKNNISYEVKFTDFQGGDFIVPHEDPNKFVADIGIITHPGSNKRRIKLAKWVTKKDFLEFHHIRDYGAGNRAAVSQEYMKDMDVLNFLMVV